MKIAVESTDDMKTGQVSPAQECIMRARLYRLLARLYRVEVDQAVLDELKASSAAQGNPGDLMASGMNAIVDYAKNADDNALTDLAVDYVRTFIGSGTDGHEAAYPFESVYLSEKHLMMQAPRDEVRAIYLSEGLDKADDWKVGEDHMALELEFMATLAERCAEAMDGGDDPEAARLLRCQRNFLSDHIAAWGRGLTADMRRCAKTAFYQGVADMTDGLILADLEYLAEE